MTSPIMDEARSKINLLIGNNKLQNKIWDAYLETMSTTVNAMKFSNGVSNGLI